MQRFYFDINLWTNILIQNKNFFHQISHVLRSKIWDEIILFNWNWNEYIYKIWNIKKEEIKLNFIKNFKNKSDLNIEINLYQSMPNKYEKIEYILETWIDIWISNFYFFYSKRSQKLSINENKKERFKFIIKESLEQCDWNKMPNLFFENKLNLEKIIWEKIVLHTKENKKNNLKIFCEKKKINLFVWPEWWWDENELTQFEENNFTFLNFWSRILRTETAWIIIWFLISNLGNIK